MVDLAESSTTQSTQSKPVEFEKLPRPSSTSTEPSVLCGAAMGQVRGEPDMGGQGPALIAKVYATPPEVVAKVALAEGGGADST
jgi:hypothetical protein